ncbi:MAG: di-trans,poly-cis-decaprenylcistransferase, partial [Clostridia bacterium]|nr:di-trans,poly-cis-decaprenylcistransferase [Clostridia bacterium]
ILRKFLKKYKPKLIRDRVRLIMSGDLSEIPDSLREQCENCMEDTSAFSYRYLNIALNYGSRAEIVKAANDLIKSGKKEITEEDFSSALYTSLLPDIDLVVRTSGEQRLSNFFLWQCAYAELYFTDVLWPDFNNAELDKAIEWFNGRGRRFGGV